MIFFSISELNVCLFWPWFSHTHLYYTIKPSDSYPIFQQYNTTFRYAQETTNYGCSLLKNRISSRGKWSPKTFIKLWSRWLAIIPDCRAILQGSVPYMQREGLLKRYRASFALSCATFLTHKDINEEFAQCYFSRQVFKY